jgi:MFS family permease
MVCTALAIFFGWAYDVCGRQATVICGLIGMTIFLTLLPAFAGGWIEDDST